MRIFRNNRDNKLYVISHLVNDIRFTNNNEFIGIYAKPYKWNGTDIIYRSKSHPDCMKFVETNFSEISYC